MPVPESPRAPNLTPDQIEQLLTEIIAVIRPLIHRHLTGLAADEAIQDVLIALYRRLLRSTPPEKVKAEARTAAWRRCKLHFRLENRRSKIGESNHDLTRIAAPDRSDGRVEAWERVERALAKLDENSRKLLLLTYWEGLSEAELARRVGGDRFRAHRALAKAKNRFRESL